MRKFLLYIFILMLSLQTSETANAQLYYPEFAIPVYQFNAETIGLQGPVRKVTTYGAKMERIFGKESISKDGNGELSTFEFDTYERLTSIIGSRYTPDEAKFEYADGRLVQIKYTNGSRADIHWESPDSVITWIYNTSYSKPDQQLSYKISDKEIRSVAYRSREAEAEHGSLKFVNNVWINHNFQCFDIYENSIGTMHTNLSANEKGACSLTSQPQGVDNQTVLKRDNYGNATIIKAQQDGEEVYFIREIEYHRVMTADDMADRYIAVQDVEPEKVFESVEQPAEFPGGQAELFKWLVTNLRYPKTAYENDIQGRVIVKFVVETNGVITNASVVRGVDPALDKEAIRIVKSMPRWKPGKCNGVPVRSYYILPITFKLSN